MHARPAPRSAFFLVCLAAARALPAGADPTDETQRWVPSIGLTSGVFAQKADASTHSTGLTYNFTLRQNSFGQEVDTVTQITNANLRPPTDGDDILVTPFVGGTLELDTPGVQAWPGRPRLFVRGDVAAAFGTERKIAREKTPSSVPDSFTAQPDTAAEGSEGVGSETTAEVQPFMYSAGAGIAFTIDIGTRRLRIKPSVEYIHEQIDFTGKIIRAVNTDTGITAQQGITAKPAVFFGVTLEKDEKQDFQGLGPGLELELDTARVGPFMLSIFTNGRGMKVLGDRKVEWSDSTTVTNPAMVPNTTTFDANWEFEKKPWIFGGGVGIRFRWVPQ